MRLKPSDVKVIESELLKDLFTEELISEVWYSEDDQFILLKEDYREKISRFYSQLDLEDCIRDYPFLIETIERSKKIQVEIDIESIYFDGEIAIETEEV